MAVVYFTVTKVYFAFVPYLLWSCQIKSIFSGGPFEFNKKCIVWKASTIYCRLWKDSRRQLCSTLIVCSKPQLALLIVMRRSHVCVPLEESSTIKLIFLVFGGNLHHTTQMLPFLSFKVCDKNLHESGSKLLLLATLTLLQKKFALLMIMEVVCKVLSIYSVTEIIGQHQHFSFSPFICDVKHWLCGGKCHQKLQFTSNCSADVYLPYPPSSSHHLEIFVGFTIDYIKSPSPPPHPTIRPSLWDNLDILRGLQFWLHQIPP